MSYLFSFPRYQTKCIIKFLFSQLIMSQTIRFMLGQHLKQWLTGRKRGEDGKSFLDEIKTFFVVFEGLFFQFLNLKMR